jgi:AraC-like DNA-binding protein
MNVKISNLSEKVIQYVLGAKDAELRSLTVMALARHFGIDRSHLTRVFRTCHNCTPRQFIHREKMTRAATLLRDPSTLTIKQISHRLGFASPEYFSKVFKAHFDILPHKYRRYKNQNTQKPPPKRAHPPNNQTEPPNDNDRESK